MEVSPVYISVLNGPEDQLLRSFIMVDLEPTLMGERILEMADWCRQNFGSGRALPALKDEDLSKIVWIGYVTLFVLSFHFKHPSDAILFKLKYSEWCK